MVQMTKHQRKKYTKLAEFVDSGLDNVVGNTKVFAAFKNWVQKGGYTKADYLVALEGSKGPLVVVRPLKGYGGFTALFRNRVYVDKDFVKDFEKSGFSDPDQRLLMQATILHELIHLYDYKGDWKFMPEGEATNSDFGANDFEREAYGRVVA